MLSLLRREWDRARAGGVQARAGGGSVQPENLTSVRRVAREVLAQVSSQNHDVCSPLPGSLLVSPHSTESLMLYAGLLMSIKSMRWYSVLIIAACHIHSMAVATSNGSQSHACSIAALWSCTRYITRHLWMQLDTRIENLTARQRDRQPTVERPRIAMTSDRPPHFGYLHGMPPPPLQCMNKPMCFLVQPVTLYHHVLKPSGLQVILCNKERC